MIEVIHRRHHHMMGGIIALKSIGYFVTDPI